MSENEQENGAPIVVTVGRLMEIYGIQTRKTIGEWVSAGMPKMSRGQYDLVAVIRWKMERDESSDNVAKDSKERYWQAKADNEEIKRDQARSELLPMSEIMPEWCARVGEVKQGLLSLKIQLPPVLEGKSRDEMRDIIDKYTRSLCEGYARNGKYTPAEAVKVAEPAAKVPAKAAKNKRKPAKKRKASSKKA